jgi:hypothetical protein
MILSESNQDINNLVKFIDKSIIFLRKNSSNNRIVQKYLSVYKRIINNLILPWTEKYHLKNIELNREDEELMINILLDYYNTIKFFIERIK